MNPRELNGLHMPNCLLKDFRVALHEGPPDGDSAFWRRAALAGARWVKMLSEHSRGDAEQAGLRGMRVLRRVKGEWEVFHKDVLADIGEFGPQAGKGKRLAAPGTVAVLECGNEPPREKMWEYLFYLDKIADECLAPAEAAGILLCTGGGTGRAEPPNPEHRGKDWQDESLPEDVRLDAQTFAVFDRFPLIGVHVYAEHVFDGHVERLLRWAAAFPGKRLVVTEAMLTAKDLLAMVPLPGHFAASEFIKAERCAAFLREVAQRCPAVLAVFWFIAGGTEGFASFTKPDEYDPAGPYTCWLSDQAWEWLGRSIP